MNESELEDELRKLSPKSPSARLAERIELELDSSFADVAASRAMVATPKRMLAGVVVQSGDRSRSAQPWWRSLGWAFAGAAAMGVIWMGSTRTSETLTSKPTGTVAAAVQVAEGLNETPDESVAELVASTDEGLVYDDSDELQRQVRMVFVERHIWTNSETGAVVEFEVPREDVVLMPVAMQ